MKSVANHLRHALRLFVVAILFLMLPFIGITPHAAAVDKHTEHTEQHVAVGLDCAAACARAATAVPLQGVLNENQTYTPDPEPQELALYHSQFQVLYVPEKILPSATYSALPGRPPDIVKLAGHFLF